MRILFCHYTYPGQFEPFVAELASDPENSVLFLSSSFKRDFSLPNVSVVQLRGWRARGDRSQDQTLLLRESQRLIEMGNIAYQALMEIRKSGFVPDIIFTSLTDGIGLFLRMAFPEAFVVSYFEDLRRIANDPVEHGKGRVELFFRSAQMMHSDLSFVMAAWHRKLLPPLLRQATKVMPYFADTDFFVPGGESEGELVSFNLKSINLGIRKRYMPVIAGLLERRPQCRAVLCVGSRALRQIMEKDIQDFPEHLRPRCEIAEFLPLEEYRRVLQQSALHVCPDAMEPPIREMLECLSCETLLMGPDGLSKFVLPLPSDNPLDAICGILDHRGEYDAHRKNGRRAVVRHREKKRAIRAHIDYIMQEYAHARGK
ncbi:MAG: hypothetical protein MJ061_06630 [Mailhella sp.]|nr:hypothetical protein [Mailhella sp.]